MSDYVSDSRLERILKAGHLGVTSECGPPRGSDPEEVKEKRAADQRPCGCSECHGQPDRHDPHVISGRLHPP
jgi:hypothetical protein